VIIAGDMNAHSTVWNGRASGCSNATFWENLIEDEALVVWNSEEAIRVGPRAGNHSIIDLTLSSPNIELNWSTAAEEDATGSDHEVIAWKVLGGRLTYQWRAQQCHYRLGHQRLDPMGMTG
jgi:hypothetical protein